MSAKIRYVDSVENISAEMLRGFFEGWRTPPSPETHLRMLRNSACVVLAVDDEAQRVAGFTYAISDGILSAYVPLLEVLPSYRRQGIGSELLRRLLAKLHRFYMVDVVCDPELQGFYERHGLKPSTAMVIRNYDWQRGC